MAKIADESEVSWLSDLGTFYAVWVLVLILIAWRAPTLSSASVRAVGFFLGLTVGYYAFSVFVLGFPGGQLARRWAVLAVTGVPLLAAGVRWASRQSGLLAAVVVAGVAGLAILDGSTINLWRDSVGSGMPAGVPRRPVQAGVEMVTVLAAFGLAARDWRTRAWSLALLVPAVWVMPEAIGWGVRFVS